LITNFRRRMPSPTAEQSLRVPFSYFDPGRGFLRDRRDRLRSNVEQRRFFLKRDFGVDFGEIRVIRALREVGQDEILRAAVEPVLDPVGEIFVREGGRDAKECVVSTPTGRRRRPSACRGYDFDSMTIAAQPRRRSDTSVVM
jgi:hypothetical protein